MNHGFKAKSTAIPRGSYYICTSGLRMTDKPALRQQMRTRRNKLSSVQQQQAAKSVAIRLQKHPLFQHSHRIAGYLANDGEVDPTPLLQCAQRLGKHIYLPVLAGQSLSFVRYRPGVTSLHTNQFGIPEPRALPSQTITPEQLDLVLLPLVAFDCRGGRLGMGGGFYDRTFAFKRRRQQRSRPLLLGLAHQLQRVPALPLEHWDVTLAGIATDNDLLLVSNPQRKSSAGQRENRELRGR